MITRTEQRRRRNERQSCLQKTGLAFRPDELAGIEVADFGLGELAEQRGADLDAGEQREDRRQAAGAHPRPNPPGARASAAGILRGQRGDAALRVGRALPLRPRRADAEPEGASAGRTRGHVHGLARTLLRPGDQITFEPNTPHWFQAGPEGAVVWSFSTKAVDVQDVFTDPQVARQTVIGE